MKNLHQWIGRTAIVVDDSLSMRLEASRMLKELGFATVLTAEDGNEALKILNSGEVVDFLLTDLNMPTCDGIELLNEIEKRYAGRLYAAVMSSLDSSLLSSVKEIAENSDLELIGTLPKPITLELLSSVLHPHDPERHRALAGKRSDSISFSGQEFAAALVNHEIEAFFQPKVSLHNGQITGVEALARWCHPERGLISPLAFIEHIESGPNALPHFLYQLDLSLALLEQTDPLTPGLTVNMNLPVPLLVISNLVDLIATRVQASPYPATRFVFEVTETSIMSNLRACLSTLTRLRMKGFGIAMDDYGTGYSSMKQLAKCPFTELKIDQSFVHASARDLKLMSILSAAVGICEKLNLNCVAEGIEDVDDWRLVRSLNCEFGQGYYFTPPLPVPKLLTYLGTRN